MTKLVKRYRTFLVLIIANIILGFIFPQIGKDSIVNAKSNLSTLLAVLPPIFVLLGLLDVWVEKETMIKFLGKGSGLKGFLIAFIMGSFAAGPLYAAFPVASVMLKKRASIFNVFVFIGAWSTTKVPMETFEIVSMGPQFALTRLALSFIGILLIAIILSLSLKEDDIEDIYTISSKVI